MLYYVYDYYDIQGSCYDYDARKGIVQCMRTSMLNAMQTRVMQRDVHRVFRIPDMTKGIDAMWRSVACS